MKGLKTKREPPRCIRCQREMQDTHRRIKHPICSDCRLGYRVDLWLELPQCYTEYTAKKEPVTREMAEALGRGLKRQGAGGRIVAVPSEQIIDEWGRHVATA